MLQYCCVTRLFLKTCSTYVYSAQTRSSWQTMVWIPPKSNTVNQLILLRILIGMWGRGRQKWLTDKCITKAHPCMGESLPELGTWSPGQPAELDRTDSKLESVLSKWLSWYKPPPGSHLAFTSSRQPSGLVSESLQLGSPERDAPAARPVCFREGRVWGIWSVHRLPEALLSYLPSGWRRFPAGWSVSISEDTFAQQKLNRLISISKM